MAQPTATRPSSPFHTPAETATPAPGSWAAPVLAWAALIGVAVWWGRASIVGRGLGINAAPLVGRWSWEPRILLAIPVVVAAVVIVFGPRAASRARWPLVPATAGLSATVWALALAVSDGWDRVTEPLTTRHEYEPFAATVGSARAFLRDYATQLPGRPIHVQGHPPGATLVPWALDRIGLEGAGWLAALALLAWGLAVGAALVAAKVVAGEEIARRAAPAMVLLPAAIWAGTSADALFAGVIVLGVALAVVPTARSALAGGVVLGVALLLTYGAVPLLAVPVGLHLMARRPMLALRVVVGVVAVIGVVAVTSGFWWLDGLSATRRAYAAGVASERPNAYFALVGNPGALALAIGPAVAIGLVVVVRRWRAVSSRLPLLGLLAVTAANVSLLSKGEVERIWLPFVPLLGLAAPGDRRGWLVAQAVLALGLQAWLRTKW